MMDALLVAAPARDEGPVRRGHALEHDVRPRGRDDDVEGSEGVPDFFVKEMLFPYVAGTAWIEARSAGGAGWTRHRRALQAAAPRRPPRSSTPTATGAARAPRARRPSRRPPSSRPGCGSSTRTRSGNGCSGRSSSARERRTPPPLAAEWQRRPHPLLRAEGVAGRGAARSGSSGASARPRPTPRAGSRRALASALRAAGRPARSRPSTASGDRVEVVRGRSRSPPRSRVSSPAGTSAPPAGK